MSINNKLVVLAILIVITLGSFIYLQKLQETQHSTFKAYEKTSNEIEIITKLKNYYGEPKKNKRKIYNIIAKYKKNTLSKKETKKTLEFTISKLKHKELDALNKQILNSGLRIVKLTINKKTSNTGELFCKVMF